MKSPKKIESLFKRHYPPMLGVAVNILHDTSIARDIVHDVFLSLIEKNIPDISLSYLLKATKNRCLNYIRDIELHEKITNLFFIETQDYTHEEWPDANTISLINDIMATCLTERQRQIMDLRFVEGMKFSDIAEKLRISEAAVYAHVGKSLILIRQKLRENG